MNVPQSIFTVFIAGKNVTADISDRLLSVEYTDHSGGEADTISISIENADQKWLNEWWPDKNTEVSLEIGYEGLILNCGKFRADQIELAGPPDTLTIRGIAAAGKLRTKKSYAHEDKTLREIVQTVADSLGFTVEGEIKNIKIERCTQNNLTDLQFLRKLADKYGYYFSVRDTVITFTSEIELDKSDPVFEIDRRDMIKYSFSDKTDRTYSSAKVAYRNPVTGKDVQSAVTWDDVLAGIIPGANAGISSFLGQDGQTAIVGGVGQKIVKETQASPYEPNTPVGTPVSESIMKTVAGDELFMNIKAENEQQAEEMATAGLYKANKSTATGSITVPGNPTLVAGNTIMISGMGKLSGKYSIKTSRHAKTRSGGYECTLEIQRVAVSTSTRNKSVKKPAPTASARPTFTGIPPVTAEIPGLG